MNQLLSLKQLRIKKDMLLLTLEEKKQIRSRALLYLGIFLLLFIGMVMLDSNPNSADVSSPPDAKPVLADVHFHSGIIYRSFANLNPDTDF